VKIEIDDDCVESIIGAALVNTYIWLTEDLKTAKKNPLVYHEDDVEMWEKLIPALEIVAEWYVYNFKAEVKKARKAMK